MFIRARTLCDLNFHDYSGSDNVSLRELQINFKMNGSCNLLSSSSGWSRSYSEKPQKQWLMVEG